MFRSTNNQPFLGINKRNVALVMQHNAQKWMPLADDKIQTKSWLASMSFPHPTTYAIANQLGQIDPTWNHVEIAHSSCVVKPARGSKGGGIFVLKKKGVDWFQGNCICTKDQIKRHLANIIFGMYSNTQNDQAIIEERIVGHEGVKSIFDQGLADIRIISLEGKLLMAMLRIPTIQSNGKANLHQGGIGIGIDIDTGTTTHAIQNSRGITIHPDSGKNLLKLVIPYWKDIVNLAICISKSCPLKFIGQDLVIDQNKGPMVLELNARPGLSIQLANHIKLDISK